MTHRGLDTCSWDEVDEQVSKLCDRLQGVRDYMLSTEGPLTRGYSDWLDATSDAYEKAKALREATYNLYAYGEK